MALKNPVPSSDFKYLLKKRKLATLHLYICIFVASWLCLFTIGKHKANLDNHDDHIKAQIDAVLHYVRFKSITQRDSVFYQYCVIHAIFNRMFKPKESIGQSLISLREIVDFTIDDKISNEKKAVKSQHLEQFLEYLILNTKNITFAAKELRQYIDSGKVADADKKGYTDASGQKPITLCELLWYVPSDKPDEVAEWIYRDQFNDRYFKEYINSAINYNTIKFFSNKHNHAHEETYVYYLLSLTPKYDSVKYFLDNRWRYLTDIIVTDDAQVAHGGSTSAINLHGIEFSLGFLLYIIGPAIFFFYTREYRAIATISHRYPNIRINTYQYLLYNYKLLYSGLPFGNTISKVLKIIEISLRCTGLAIIFYGCLFRFNYIDLTTTTTFNLVVKHHYDFDFIDLINLGALLATLSIFSSYSMPDIKKTFFNKWWVAYPLNIFCLLLLPFVLFVLTFFTNQNFFNDYISFYSLMYSLSLCLLLFNCFNYSWMSMHNTAIYYAICFLFVLATGLSTIKNLYLL